MNVAMVHYGDSPHPAHQGFAESINADIISCSSENGTGLVSAGKEIVRGAQLEYDVLIAEGSRPLIPILTQGLFQDCKVLYLCADQFFYDVNFSTGSNAAKTCAANLVLRGIVDGIIAVSDFAGEFVRAAVGASIPMRVVHPYIQKSLFNELENVSPDLRSMTAVTISSAPDGKVGRYKGVDLLVESWDEVRDKFPDATLRVVGEGHPEVYGEKEGVQLEGYVDSIADVFRSASLYIQPSRADTYPVAVLEALRAGVPTIVTRTTGNRSEVRTIDPMLVSEPTPASLAEKIGYYLGSDLEYKEEVSQLARQRGGQYSPQRWKSAFRCEFESLVREISG